ncbi:MAG: glycosidase, partial [Myxococcota bacterium]
FDGFRIDAVKHMHDNFLLTMRQKIRDSVETVPGAFFYTVGETFAGGWGGGNGPNETIIKKYISPDQMTGQFDFPMYWEVLNFFARNATVATGLTDLLEASFGYYGPGSVMSNFLGNHDVPRFISHATNEVDNLFGDGSKELGWDNPPNFPDYDEPYDRLKLAFSFLMSIPGIPLIYYGDEIGMPGAGDPDNRRPMFFDNWDGRQQGVYNHIGAVAAVRSSLVALRRGGYRTLYTQPDVMVFERATADQTVIVALNRSSNSVAIPMGGAKDGTYTGAFGGDGITVSGGSATIDLGPWATRILAQ